MELRIPCAELYLRLGDEDVLVLDCRCPEHWEEVEFHIPGALRMSPDEVARDLFILPDDELIVLCGCEQDGEEVLRLCRLLVLRGRNAVCLQGGIQGWMNEGFPTERHLCPTPTFNSSREAGAEGW
ncbi:rhodanese-like domain-containing protein [Hyalangium rubrum]|uniref:Rhodanese-like domain-containing protein n=1 Tax=Hyalangium rubrum TaxID=3103134 RepID=A0ABU5HBR1_9BACT|nr:rhodanese-like domain-containing protein [Hyalangium sp. s54d21]MDY7230915.1 rhodanese-like domain-containing protein [Hyalangium sp. s54d21]